MPIPVPRAGAKENIEIDIRYWAFVAWNEKIYVADIPYDDEPKWCPIFVLIFDLQPPLMSDIYHVMSDFLGTF